MLRDEVKLRVLPFTGCLFSVAALILGTHCIGYSAGYMNHTVNYINFTTVPMGLLHTPQYFLLSLGHDSPALRNYK